MRKRDLWILLLALAAAVTVTISVPAPMEEKESDSEPEKPDTVVISAMTAATPMRMPRIVRKERIRLPIMLLTDMTKHSRSILKNCMIFLSIGCIAAFRQFSVNDMHRAPCKGSDIHIVSDHNDRAPFIIERLE